MGHSGVRRHCPIGVRRRREVISEEADRVEPDHRRKLHWLGNQTAIINLVAIQSIVVADKDRHQDEDGTQALGEQQLEESFPLVTAKLCSHVTTKDVIVLLTLLLL